MNIDEIKEAIKKDYVPEGVFSFGELESFRQAREKAEKTYSTLDDFIGLVYQIVSSPMIVDKAERIISLSRELETRISAPDDDDIYKAELSTHSDDPLDVYYALCDLGIISL